MDRSSWTISKCTHSQSSEQKIAPRQMVSPLRGELRKAINWPEVKWKPQKNGVEDEESSELLPTRLKCFLWYIPCCGCDFLLLCPPTVPHNWGTAREAREKNGMELNDKNGRLSIFSCFSFPKCVAVNSPLLVFQKEDDRHSSSNDYGNELEKKGE